MNKIINSRIKSEEKTIEYHSNLIINNNKMLYREDRTNVELIIIDNKVILIRKNEEINANFTFILNKKTNLKYELKKEKLKMNIEIFTKFLKIVANEIKIVYILNDIEYTYEILIKEDL